jgi:hypothetical protein
MVQKRLGSLAIHQMARNFGNTPACVWNHRVARQASGKSFRLEWQIASVSKCEDVPICSPYGQSWLRIAFLHQRRCCQSLLHILELLFHCPVTPLAMPTKYWESTPSYPHCSAAARKRTPCPN